MHTHRYLLNLSIRSNDLLYYLYTTTGCLLCLGSLCRLTLLGLCLWMELNDLCLGYLLWLRGRCCCCCPTALCSHKTLPIVNMSTGEPHTYTTLLNDSSKHNRRMTYKTQYGWSNSTWHCHRVIIILYKPFAMLSSNIFRHGRSNI